MKTNCEEYLRRNLVIAKSVGVHYGIQTIIDQLESYKKKPKRILKILKAELIKTNAITHELIQHRNEINYN